ncbi:uncharacterized protein LOC126840565 isoform X2 [Adelges cooleyi]|nr:uncharacterized protein LOC126840565 isoform X2 [Adelges cooleyi]
MDYIYILLVAWNCMSFFLNLSLIHATYKIAPQMVYAWLTVYYATFGKSVAIQVKLIFSRTLNKYDPVGILNLCLICFELYVVQSFYHQEKLASMNTFVQLKWKYLPKNKIPPKTVRIAVSNTSIIESENDSETLQDDTKEIPIFVRAMQQNP